MTQKDYEKLAQALGDALCAIESDDDTPTEELVHVRHGVYMAAGTVADTLLGDNERFDRERFMNAIRNYANAHRIKLDLERRRDA